MNDGVKLILKRMESHPEEFVEDLSGGFVTRHHKWATMIEQIKRRAVGSPTNSPIYLPFLPDEDVKAVYDKWVSIQGDQFTDAVMRVIMLDEAPEDDGLSLVTTAHPGSLLPMRKK